MYLVIRTFLCKSFEFVRTIYILFALLFSFALCKHIMSLIVITHIITLPFINIVKCTFSIPLFYVTKCKAVIYIIYSIIHLFIHALVLLCRMQPASFQYHQYVYCVHCLTLHLLTHLSYIIIHINYIPYDGTKK